MKILTDYIANNDNIIKQIKKNDNEYRIEIELWDGKIVNLETINCDSVKLYDFDANNNVVGEIEIGDINIEPYKNKKKYSFKDAWDNDRVLMEIIADKLLIKEKQCKCLKTPFGNLIVKINNQEVQFELSVENCNIDEKEKLNIDVYEISIETKDLQVKDNIDIIFDNNNLKFYGTDEHTCMIYGTKNNLLLAFIGYDTDYNFSTSKFYNGECYAFAIKNNDGQGFHYEIVRNPLEYLNWDEGHIIKLRIAWLPISNENDIEAKLFKLFVSLA